MARSVAAVWISLAGIVSLSVIASGSALDRLAAPDELICRGPFRYATLAMSADAGGSFIYRWSLRVRTASEPVGAGQDLAPGQCGLADRPLANEQANTEVVSVLSPSDVVLEFALDETGRATVTRADHPYREVQAHAGILVVQAVAAQAAGKNYYEFSGAVEFR